MRLRVYTVSQRAFGCSRTVGLVEDFYWEARLLEADPAQRGVGDDRLVSRCPLFNGPVSIGRVEKVA